MLHASKASCSLSSQALILPRVARQFRKGLSEGGRDWGYYYANASARARARERERESEEAPQPRQKFVCLCRTFDRNRKGTVTVFFKVVQVTGMASTEITVAFVS